MKILENGIFFFSDSATIEKTVSEKQETDLQD